MSGAHEASERIQAPLNSNLIAMNSQAEEVKEWFYYVAGSKADIEDQHGKLMQGSEMRFISSACQ